MSDFAFFPHTPKTEVMASIKNYLSEAGLRITAIDAERPWGGFFVIDEAQTADFIDSYFLSAFKEPVEHSFRLSPKILAVEPGKRLSWQYHDRRKELWRVLSGPVGVIAGSTDEQGPLVELQAGETTEHDSNIRHRLVGLKNWGVVAEIWQHTDPDNPSDEADIVRIKDDFGR